MPNQEIDFPLPNGQKPLPGYRLKRLEILNWGTFHGKVHILAPDGRWSLLVGENGSGKSTAVDALRTLLVPPRLLQGSYNDAARDVTEKRRADRSRRSYVRGAWMTASKEDSVSGTVQYLRDPGVQSVILAVFANDHTGRSVTLAQVLWEINDKVGDPVYAVAESDKNISSHIAGADKLHDIRRRLKTNGFISPSSYTAYAEHFRRLLGIPSETAMEVFNQAIGVKEVGDLNKFIRLHMLEGNDAVDFIRGTIRPHYVELDGCDKAIKTAEKQIEMLIPIAEAHARIEQAKSERDELQQLFDAAPVFFDTKHRDLLRHEIEQQQGQLKKLNQTKSALDDAQKFDGEQRDNLKLSLARDETEIRIQELEFQIREANSRVSERLTKYRNVQTQLTILNKPAPFETQEEFEALRNQMTSRRGLVEGNRASARQKAIDLETDKRALTQKQKDLGQELKHLQDQKANIPMEFAMLRQAICAVTNIPVEDLPFVGELVQVKDDYQDWTGVIERMMRGFGISLVVPESRYDAVSRYVNGRRLADPQNPNRGLRLEFFRVQHKAEAPRFNSGDERFVFGRLEFHPDQPMSGWVAKAAVQRFRHVCCDSIEQFQREFLAVTREGSIRDGERHVKDDRRRISDPSDYVLGWSNEKKLQAVLREFTSCQQQFGNLEKKIADSAKHEKELEKQFNAIEAILAVQTFSEVDFRSEQRQAEALGQQKAELENSSEARKTLKSQIELLEQAITKRAGEVTKLTGEIAVLISNHAANQKRENELNDYLKAHANFDASGIGMRLKDLKINAEPHLEKIEESKVSAQKSIQGHITRRTTTINANEPEMQKQMTRFVGQFPEATKTLRDELSYAPSFVDLLAQVKGEELPKHQKRFEEFLGTNLVGDIATFNGRLSQEEKAVRNRIQLVNTALRDIEFSAGNYLEVVAVPNRSEEITTFKEQLMACLSRTLYPPPEERPRIFKQIQLLMEHFATDESWMRRITDVRNWYDFGVKIRRKSDSSEVEYFDKSSGKSGGQKARLAFAILASAITAQYGLVGAGNESDTFRLVVIDEVFARTDEENSQRALELFRKLGLQLLIVSPFDAKGRIVEDYVDSFHLTTNPNGSSSHIRRANRVEYESLRA
jgi:uncharacterized protein YPO0396